MITNDEVCEKCGTPAPGERCRSCLNEYQRRWRKKNRGRYKASERETKLRHKYGLGPEGYASLFRAQGGTCALCPATQGRPNAGGPLHVDHCHETGIVRGLLCTHCNVALGHIADRLHLASPVVLTYLQPPTTHQQKRRQLIIACIRGGVSIENARAYLALFEETVAA